MDIREKLINCLDSTGILIDDVNGADFDLREYIIDSLQFITSIVAIENEFGIEFPSELLIYDNLTSVNSFCEVIKNLIEQKEQQGGNGYA